MAERASPDENDIRPRVGRTVSNRGPWIFASVALAAAAVLFVSLEGRRETRTGGIVETSGQGRGIIAAPAELAIPAPPPDIASQPVIAPPLPRTSTAPYPFTPPQAAPRPAIERPYVDPVIGGAWPTRSVPQPAPLPAPPQPQAANTLPASDRAGDRVFAARLANPATTIPKGTIIQAVMETALDSTRPGFARAVVSRDVFGFDGSRVLVPRGSRLIGDYKADLQAGQKRALIQWIRLMRPDGVMIAIDSPAADPLGRAGVEGAVNSHFLARFGGAILQSALNIGSEVAVGTATRGSTAVLAIPLSQQSIQPVATNRVQPTLTVKQGASVSVFVARDLDFTGAEP